MGMYEEIDKESMELLDQGSFFVGERRGRVVASRIQGIAVEIGGDTAKSGDWLLSCRKIAGIGEYGNSTGYSNSRN